MPKFRKKPIVVEAEQWFKAMFILDVPGYYLKVGYFRHPNIPGESLCSKCGKPFHDHGYIDTPDAGHQVCPGDWVITEADGKRYLCKPDIFTTTYEVIEEQTQQYGHIGF